MSNRILVTGASGFLGSAVIARLWARGDEAIGLDPTAPEHPGVRHVEDDLSDPARLRELLGDERITHILHAGGISGPMVMADRPDRVMAINVGGSLNLLLAALEAGVKTLVYCSSVSAIGDFYEADPIGDDTPMRPATPYGCSKAAVDMVLRGLWRKTPLDLCSLRFTGIYGPGRRTAFVIDEIVNAAMERRPARVEPASDQPFLYIDDAADAAVAGCRSDRRRPEREIKRTARLFRSVPKDAALARLGEVLGIIPKNEIKLWQESTQRVPVLIAGALMGGILDHLRNVGRTRGTRFAGPKALHFNIVDRNAFGLQISQKPARTRLKSRCSRRRPAGRRRS
jgi:nucleoside-diphosphate-sugar epimerase